MNKSNIFQSCFGIVFLLLTTLSVNSLAQTPVSKIYINFTDVEDSAPAPWNNMSDFTANSTLNNLVDDNQQTTAIGLQLIDSWEGVGGGGMTGGIFADVVTQTYFYFYSDTHNIRIFGLDPAKHYSFGFFASRSEVNRSINCTIGSTTVFVAADYNTSNVVKIENVTPNSSGEVAIAITIPEGAVASMLNALIIEEQSSGSPAAPTALSASNVTSTSFTAIWEAVSGATGYLFDLSTSSAFTSYVSGYNSLSLTATSQNISGLNANTNYYYRVRATNAEGTSDNSNVITATTFIAAPVATTATPIAATSFTARWGAVSGSTGYRLDVATDLSFSNILSGYNNLSVTTTNKSITGLTSNTSYYYRVRATNASGTSDNSNTITVNTLLVAPAAAAATNKTATSFTANWGSVTGATEYRLDVSTSSSFTSFLTGYNDLSVTTTTNDVTGLSANTTYYYRVRAKNATSTSANSGNTTAKTILSAPVAGEATSVTSTSFTANWGAVTGATGYRLDVSPNSSFSSFVSGYNNLSLTTTTKSVTGLTSNATYYYRVRATNSSSTSANSNTITVAHVNTINLTSAAGTDAQTSCISTAITNITYGTALATGATITGLPAGITGNWAANVVTITGTPSVAGSFGYTITLTGGSGTGTATGTITVTPNNTIARTSAAGTDAQTVQMNTAISDITYATTGATGATVTGLPAGVTGSWAANVVTISGTPTASGSFSYTVTLTGGCAVVTITGTITITTGNTITRTSAAGTDAQTSCINTAITNITYGTTMATGATITGLPAGVTGNWTANVVTITGTPTVAGSFGYTITLTGGSGTGTATGTITVTVNNTITRTSVAGTDAQSVQINSAISEITYATTGATGATVTGLPARIIAIWSANVVIISGTPTAAGSFNYTVTLTGGCTVVTITGTITITASNTITRTSATGTDAQTIPKNTAITNITYTTTVATGATITGLPNGVTGVWAADIVTISGIPTVVGTFPYTITLTGGTGTATTTGTIAVTSVSAPIGFEAQYNGNISAIQWKSTGSTNGQINDLKEYDFHYDDINRLKGATYFNISDPSKNGSYNEEGITYDLNGNILSLARKGVDNSFNPKPNMDILSYTYFNDDKSNKLRTVSDAGEKNMGFIDGNITGDAYEYDENGNMTEDKNKGIIIEYNLLNLPSRISKGTDYIEYTYDASGTKLSKKVYKGGELTTTVDYCGEVEFYNNTIKYLHTEEGVIENAEGSFTYEYFLKDHLGNTRAVVSADGSGNLVIGQVDSYYPFGMAFTGVPVISNPGSDNKYTYNGKEKQGESLGGVALDWYDYGARFYDPQIGRFTTMDPLAEKLKPFSPYSYAINNPIRFIDYNGLTPRIYVETKGVGHAFITVGEGKNTIVYTYGRYLGGDKDKTSSNSLDPTGRGVMVKLSGKEAQRYIKHELKDMKANAYEINDASDKKIQEHNDNVMSGGRNLTDSEAKQYDSKQNKYGTSSDAKVVDQYDLLNNNCATKTVDAAKAGGTSADFINNSGLLAPDVPNLQSGATTPADLQNYLDTQSKGQNSNVKKVTDEKKKEDGTN